MAIIESGIIFQNTTIVERKYYKSEDIFSNEHRNNLLKAVDGFASEIFDDEISHFSVADYTLLLFSETVQEPGAEENKGKLMMYSIVQKGTSETVVRKSMKKILNQFLNRYSKSHLFYLRKEYLENMQKFAPRIDTEFKDLTLKSEDKVRGLFS